MALPRHRSLSEELDYVAGLWSRTADSAQFWINRTLAQGASGPEVLGIAREAAQVIDALEAAKLVPGIGAFAVGQFDDYANAAEVTADFDAMIAALEAVRDWVITTFPTSAGGFVESQTLGADGRLTPRTFTSGQTAGLRPLLQAVVDAVEPL